MERKPYTIDATNRPLGRMATRIAILLRGKDKPDFAPNKDIGGVVIVKNIKEVKLTGKKLENKIYYHHSGYLGGIKEKPLKTLFEENPAEVLRKAVYGMLPKNKLRAKIIKRLQIK